MDQPLDRNERCFASYLLKAKQQWILTFIPDPSVGKCLLITKPSSFSPAHFPPCCYSFSIPSLYHPHNPGHLQSDLLPSASLLCNESTGENLSVLLAAFSFCAWIHFILLAGRGSRSRQSPTSSSSPGMEYAQLK